MTKQTLDQIEKKLENIKNFIHDVINDIGKEISDDEKKNLKLYEKISINNTRNDKCNESMKNNTNYIDKKEFFSYYVNSSNVEIYSNDNMSLVSISPF